MTIEQFYNVASGTSRIALFLSSYYLNQSEIARRRLQIYVLHNLERCYAGIMLLVSYFYVFFLTHFRRQNVASSDVIDHTVPCQHE